MRHDSLVAEFDVADLVDEGFCQQFAVVFGVLVVEVQRQVPVAEKAVCERDVQHDVGRVRRVDAQGLNGDWLGSHGRYPRAYHDTGLAANCLFSFRGCAKSRRDAGWLVGSGWHGGVQIMVDRNT